MSALLGTLKPHWAGQLLGTGYQEFFSDTGIDGLAKESGPRLDILAVRATNKREGQFREFIAKAKHEYQEIYVWEDWNPLIGKALARYGFVRCTETQSDGEILEGWNWCLTPEQEKRK